jgi:multiple sugar transport system permease protein
VNAGVIAFLLGLVIAVVSYFVQLAGERRERVDTTDKGAES